MIVGFKESPIVHQWQTTISILITGGLMVTFAYRMLANANTQGLMTMALALGIILVAVIRDYMKKYVDTSKI